MNILVLSHMVPYPTTSGALLRSYNLLREVARHHKVYLLAMNQEVLLKSGAPLEASLEHLRSFCAEVRAFPIPSDHSQLLRLWELGSNVISSEPYSSVRFRSAAMQGAVAEALRTCDIDVIQFETLCMVPYGRLAPDLPHVLVHHNVESNLLERRAAAEPGWPARIYLRWQAGKLRAQERRLLAGPTVHIAVSDGDRASLLELEPSASITVVENGVDTVYFEPGPSPAGSDERLVFVGGMSWFPNRDGMSWFVKEVWPLILSRQPSASLVVVGGQPSRQILDTAADPAARVTVTGLVPDIRPFVREASAFIVPLHVGGGTRLKILDAWAMGKAVVSTSIGCEGLGAISGENLLIADDPTGFAAAVVEILQHPEQRLALGAAGRAKVIAEFTWRRVAAKQMAVYEELLHRPTAHESDPLRAS